MRRMSALVPGIDLPGLPIRELREQTLAAAARLSGEARILAYGCTSGANVAALRAIGVEVVGLNCIAQLPPSFLDFVISRHHADGVLLLGCRANDCHFRLGVQWTEERFAHQRDPYLRARVPRDRVYPCWVGLATVGELRREVAAFRAQLRLLGRFQPATAPAPTVAEAAAPAIPGVDDPTAGAGDLTPANQRDAGS
jgi:coenzyme F420-reducing hydrogenase delta subunit